MKILQVIHAFVPAWDYGGSLRVCYEVSKELVKRGHDVTVYTTDTLNSKERVKEREEVIEGIKVTRFRNLSNDIAYNHHLFISPGMIISLRNNLKYFDIIHLHEYRTIHNVAVHRYARKLDIPYILQAHGAIPRVAAKQRLKHVYDAIWGNKLLRDASNVIALTEMETEQYRSMGVSEDKIRIVPNGVDPLEFDNLPPRGEFRKKYGLNKNDKIILYLGRIHETKGLDLLVEAFASLSKEMDRARLVIVGPDDGYLSVVTKLTADLKVSDKVVFTGPIYERNKLEAYVDADVHVSLRAWEPFGLTLIESCACGTPVVCSEGCGIADVIDGQAGFIVPYDKDRLSNAIRHILSDDNLRREFGEKGKSLVRERFNWSPIAKQVEQGYLGCLSPKWQR